MIGDLQQDGAGPRYFGVYPAIVSGIVDPDNLGRIEVRFPWLGSAGDQVRAWATLITPYAGNDQGVEILPEVDSQVVVAFEAGDPRRPYIVGACWNGRESLPESPQEANNLRLIKSRAGSLLVFDDTQGRSKVTLSMQSGHKLELSDAGQEVKLTHANGSVITFSAAGQVRIQANSTVEVTAAAVNVHAATAKFDGIVQCTTLISNAVVSSSYTPGAGNIW